MGNPMQRRGKLHAVPGLPVDALTDKPTYRSVGVEIHLQR